MSGDPDVLTYLTDAADPRPGEGALCVGDPVVLRHDTRGGRLEAWSAATGRKLGSLPPAESAALSGLLANGADRLRGHIAALIPRPRMTGTGRIHILVTNRG